MHRSALAAVAVLGAIACSGADGDPGVVTTDAATSAAPAPATAPAALEPSEPFDVVTVTLSDPDSETSLSLQVYDAYTPPQRRLGLMDRTELPPQAGMVFRYPADSDGGFWMKNTLIPLAIAYFDADGLVHTVLDMEPCEADPCPSYPPSAPYRGALEVNQGFFEQIGLEPGWRVELPSGLPTAEA